MTLRRFLEASYALMSEGLPPPALAAFAEETLGGGRSTPAPAPAPKKDVAAQNTQSMNLMSQMLGRVQGGPGKKKPRRGAR